MDLLIILFIQLLLMIVGYLITILIGVKDKIESLGLSYLIGSGLITILFLVNHFFLGFSLGIVNFLFSIIVSTTILTVSIFLTKKQGQIFSIKFSSIKKALANFNCFEKFILSFLILILGYTLLENFTWPVTDWDALALYDFRAKVMAVKGNMLEGVRLGYFFQYPPYTSFLHVFGYIFGAERVRVAYSFIYFSLITVFYSLLKRNQKGWISLLGALMLAVDIFIFRHATMAYTNLSYVVFLSLGLIYLGFWLTSSNKKELLLGSILIALSTWVRASDPFWYVGLIIIVVGVLKNKKHFKNGIYSIFLLVGTYKFWDVFVKSLDIPSSKKVSRESTYLNTLLNNSNALFDIFKSAPVIFTYFWQNISQTIGYLLPVLIFTAYYDLKKKNQLNKYLYAFLVLTLLLIIIGIAIFSLYYDSWDRIGGSLQRLSMVLIPIIIFIIFNSSIWKEDLFEKR